MVYVLNINGQPLMPTERHGKIRRLLRDGRAKVIKSCPFTIQLLYETTNVVQEITLGVDTGSKVIGLSATTEKRVLFESEVTLRNDIVKLFSARRELRHNRRYRKCRYRKARFLNRVHFKKEGWLAPSIKHKIDTHLKVIDNVYKMLPISKIIVEVASFDIQKIKNPDIQGEEYRQGEQLGFWNVREYVLFRDGYKCQCCYGKSEDKILNVHHIESRQTGGDAPNNLITLCETCHKKFHKGKIELPKQIKRGMKFKDAVFMGIMRWKFYNTLKEKHDNVLLTFGYITKHNRISVDLPKEHYIDARCISGNLNAISDGSVYYQRKIRCHNRQIHKCTINKNNYRKLNQLPYLFNGYRLFDKVLCKNKVGFISARRKSGFYCIKNIFGNFLSTGISFHKLKFLNVKQYYICDKVVKNV